MEARGDQRAGRPDRGLHRQGIAGVHDLQGLLPRRLARGVQLPREVPVALSLVDQNPGLAHPLQRPRGAGEEVEIRPLGAAGLDHLAVGDQEHPAPQPLQLARQAGGQEVGEVRRQLGLHPGRLQEPEALRIAREDQIDRGEALPHGLREPLFLEGTPGLRQGDHLAAHLLPPRRLAAQAVGELPGAPEVAIGEAGRVEHRVHVPRPDDGHHAPSRGQGREGRRPRLALRAAPVPGLRQGGPEVQRDPLGRVRQGPARQAQGRGDARAGHPAGQLALHGAQHQGRALVGGADARDHDGGPAHARSSRFHSASSATGRLAENGTSASGSGQP